MAVVIHPAAASAASQAAGAYAAALQPLQPLQTPETSAALHRDLRQQELHLEFGPGPLNLAQQPHLGRRSEVVRWITALGKHFGLCGITRATAVAYLDRVLRTMDVPPLAFELAAVVCLVLAAKWEEREQCVPTMADVLACTNHIYSRAEVEVTEMVILQTFDWRLMTVAPAAYLDFYARYTLELKDTLEGRPVRDLDGLEAMMRDVAESILELCSEDVDLASSLPSVRAVAAITLARMSLHVAPAWSPLLEAVSGYTYADVQPCLMAAMRLGGMDFTPHLLPSGTEETAKTMVQSPNAVPLSAHASSDSGFYSPSADVSLEPSGFNTSSQSSEGNLSGYA